MIHLIYSSLLHYLLNAAQALPGKESTLRLRGCGDTWVTELALVMAVEGNALLATQMAIFVCKKCVIPLLDSEAIFIYCLFRLLIIH